MAQTHPRGVPARAFYPAHNAITHAQDGVHVQCCNGVPAWRLRNRTAVARSRDKIGIAKNPLVADIDVQDCPNGLLGGQVGLNVEGEVGGVRHESRSRVVMILPTLQCC